MLAGFDQVSYVHGCIFTLAHSNFHTQIPAQRSVVPEADQHSIKKKNDDTVSNTPEVFARVSHSALKYETFTSLSVIRNSPPQATKYPLRMQNDRSVITPARTEFFAIQLHHKKHSHKNASKLNR